MTIERKFAERIDMRFKWTGSAATDVGATFKRVRREQEAKAEAARVAAEAQAQEVEKKVRRLK